MKQSKMLVTLTMMALAGVAAEGADRRHGPSAEDRAAFQACFAAAGVTVSEGERPQLSDDQRAQVDSCLQAKGIQRPPRGGEGGPGRHGDFAKMKACLEEAGVTLPKPERGQCPQFDDATKAAMDACRAKLEGASDAGGDAGESESASGVSSAL